MIELKEMSDEALEELFLLDSGMEKTTMDIVKELCRRVRFANAKIKDLEAIIKEKQSIIDNGRAANLEQRLRIDELGRRYPLLNVPNKLP